MGEECLEEGADVVVVGGGAAGEHLGEGGRLLGGVEELGLGEEQNSVVAAVLVWLDVVVFGGFECGFDAALYLSVFEATLSSTLHHRFDKKLSKPEQLFARIPLQLNLQSQIVQPVSHAIADISHIRLVAELFVDCFD